MSIVFHEQTKTFHLFNDRISYIMNVLPTGHLMQLYCGKKVHDREDFSYLIETSARPTTTYLSEEWHNKYTFTHLKQEYPVYGTTDFRHPAIEIKQNNGSNISNFCYKSHSISSGKPKLAGLPATYTENDNEAQTLTIVLEDELTHVQVELLYTLFAQGGIIARSAKITNNGAETVHLTTAMSLCLDLPDCDYEWLQFSGSWARERHLKVRKLEQGITSVESTRGASSHEHNPFVILKRPSTDENKGEAIGFSLVYSGNFLAQAEVDTHDVTRVLIGINPFCFDWKLAAGGSFQTPEAVMVYTADGLNDLSQTYHKLYQKRLARGYWRDRPRPILINNWEATYFDFNEDKLVKIAQKAKECGVELFVLDDGWFGKRTSDTAGLGDWVPNTDLLPNGITGLSHRIEELGMKFGLWIEPEMTNMNSDLYRAHPDWILHVPGRHPSECRHQYVLNYSRPEVVDYIYNMLAKILTEGKVSYIKWDMNRYITECYSVALPADQQGEVFHRYILGVYSLYERLTTNFPHILFESCASGGARFDPGLLYYAPQGWTSDDSDAVERLKIQYGTSYCYPVSSMGSHVSVIPNHQVYRNTPLHTRANVAYFGTFGYELDLNKLAAEEQEEVKEQIKFMKQYREVIQFGTFYRLNSPFNGNVTSWMVVSEDKKTAIVGWYRVLNGINLPYSRVQLQGLNSDYCYETVGTQECHFGDELMNIGLIINDPSAGQVQDGGPTSCDFDSKIYVLKAK
ncbi:MAG TPA: alpha-galactosidase [Megamonas hypermegale]|uniref:Alpha-galactosidase n=1 Tax=Megamonas hypermegale TaxID=158847 RepID=A0A921HP26_9FIRM|nr:alpha-galactosidase [Megamonas hypermegale]